MTEAWNTVAGIARGAVLHVDGAPIPGTRLEGVEPSEMWACSGAGTITFATVSAPRPAVELYRVLSLLERLVVPGGVILILPYDATANIATENRWEATEAFIGVYPWSRRLLPGNVIELRKGVTIHATQVGTTAIEVVRADIAAKNQGVHDERLVVQAPTLKRVISLAAFGTGGYWAYLGAFVRAHHTLFPGYTLRVHVDDGVYRAPYGGALHALAERGLVEMKHMPTREGRGKCEGMLWRLAPAWDPTVEYVFARDLDALPTWRERCVVEEFIDAAKTGQVNAHAIHDNSAHAGLMGGLCGFYAEALREIAPTFEEFVAAAGFSDARWAEHGADQDYLNGKISSRVKIFEHSVFKMFEEDGTRLFRKPTWWAEGKASVRFETAIVEVNDPRVPEIIRAPSDKLVNYMGTAGYDIDQALTFYDEHCPVIETIRDAEREAGETAKGERA